MITKLCLYIEHRYKMAERGSFSEKIDFYHQAFGAVDFFIQSHPTSKQRVTKLWEEIYKPKFEKLIYDAAM